MTNVTRTALEGTRRDAGHRPELGVLVPADDAPALAAAAEAAGLDVVAVQDLPGRHDHAPLDPWTALAVAAARTTRIGLAALDLVPTNPVLLARSAASLDLLADGRLRLGLADVPGADEVVRALRTLWREEPVRSPGPVHPVPGTAGGPAPAHDVPVWTRTRVEAADGVVGPPGEVAAAGADDPPRDVLVLDVPDALEHAAVADALTRAVVDGGATVVLVPATTRDAVRTVAAAADRARSHVARTRAERGTPPAPTRPARVRRARVPGIDYDHVPVPAVEPGDARYAGVRSTYLRGGRPGLVLQPRDTVEVARALTWAREQDVELVVRSGGHGISGRSTTVGGLVLDLGRLAGVDVSDDGRVRVGPGARWGHVARVLDPHGRAVTSGDHGGVGVGGLATAGGIGFLGRLHGLTIDHVRAVEVVLADGSVVRASADEDPELFWGVRGAGGSLGVVTAFELDAPHVGDVGFAQLVLAVPDVAAFLEGFGALVESAPRDLTPFLLLGSAQGVPVAQVMAMVASGDPDVVVDRLQPIARLAPLVQQQVALGRYADVVRPVPSAHHGQGAPVTRSGLVGTITPDLAAAVADLVASGGAPFFQVRSVGGAIADVAPDATAYAHRSASFSLLAMGTDRARLDAAWAPVHEHVVGVYSSFETDLAPERVTEVYPGTTLDRLRALKRRVDPDDVFRHNMPVRP